MLGAAALPACNSSYTPKPRGYFKINFPERKYQRFDMPGYPYTFEYPVYARVLKDSTFFDSLAENPWWINIEFPGFGGTIHVSYKAVNKNFDKLVEDAYKMAFKQHSLKAYAIEDSLMRTQQGLIGMYYTLQGNTATGNQFFLSDSVKHFLRGALYFDAAPNQDSLGIVNEFLKQDMLHLINTLKWR
jgi:gliding motility-associated lipoprotein GldD